MEALLDDVFSEQRLAIMKRRREWFVPMAVAYTALWCVPAGHVPTTGEAEGRVRLPRKRGPTAAAFVLRRTWPAPNADGQVGEGRGLRSCLT